MPLPISCLVIPLLLISLLSNTRNKTNTIYFVALSFFLALFSLSFSNRLNFSNFLNLTQFFLPLIAIICGEIIGSNKKLDLRFLRYFAFVASFVMIFQIIFTIIGKTESLNPNILILYIYQTEQYSSLALVLIFFIFIYKQILVSQSIFFNYKLCLLFTILVLYIFYSQNLLYYLYFCTFIIFFTFFSKRYIFGSLFSVLIISLYICFGDNKLFFDIDIFLHYRTVVYHAYLIEIFNTSGNFLLGSNLNNELYKNLPGVFNYYLDFIYNFGFISFAPILLLIIITFKKTFNLKNFIFSNKINLALFFIIILILFIDSFLKVSLKQPYIGIIVFLFGEYIFQD